MLISVCTVLAEGEDSLEALLTSVAAQQATLELEVVVVDRGSRALPGVLADWLPRLPRLAVVRCQGLDELAAWRRAVAVATGELLRFIPPALTLPPEALQRALVTLLPNPQCLGIYGDLDGYSRVVPLGQPVPLDTLLLRRAALDHGCVLIQEPVDGRLACRPAAAQPGSLTYLPAVLAAAPRAGAVIGAPTAAVPAGSPAGPAGAGSLERYAAAVVESWQPPVSPTPDVTVVVRTHGEPREWLAAAVQSALDQADVRVEVIVVDDLSPLPVAPFADRRCGLLRLGFNHGLAGARVAGLRHARGRHVRLLDADDQLPAGALARQVYELALHPEAVLCAGRLEVAGTPEEVAEVCPSGDWCQHDLLRSLWDGDQESLAAVLLGDSRTLVPGPAVMWRRDPGHPLVPLDLVHCDDNAQYRLLLAAHPHAGAARWVNQSVLRFRRNAQSNSGWMMLDEDARFRGRCVQSALAAADSAVQCELLAQRVRDPLKVAYLDWRLDVGGAQWSLAQTARHFDRRLVEPCFLVQLDSPIVDWLTAEGVAVQRCPPGTDFSSWAAGVIAQQGFEVVDFPWAAKLATPPLRAAAPKLVTHVQSTYAGWAKLAEHDDDVWSLFDGFIAVAAGIPPVFPWLRPMEVIPSPVDSYLMRQLAAGREAVRAALGYAPDDLVVVWTGRIVAPVKRAEVMAQVAAEVQKRCPRVRFLVLGYIHEYLQEYEDSLRRWRQWAAETGNQILTTLPPWQAQKIVAAGDVYLNTSTAEGLSLAMIEAMAAGLAPVVTDVCGAREAITPGVSGHVVGVDDWPAMASCLRHLAEHPETAKALGQRAARWAASHYDSRYNARLHALYYHRLVGIDPPGSQSSSGARRLDASSTRPGEGHPNSAHQPVLAAGA